MRKSIYPVVLTEEERIFARGIVKAGKGSARVIRRANMLLMMDENTEPTMKREDIAALLGVSPGTVHHVSKQYCDADTPYGHNPNSHKGTVLTRAFPVLAKKSMHGMFKSRYLGWQSYHELIRCIPRKTIIVKSDKSSNCTPFER